jgi:hypothetical protein
MKTRFILWTHFTEEHYIHNSNINIYSDDINKTYSQVFIQLPKSLHHKKRFKLTGERADFYSEFPLLAANNTKPSQTKSDRTRKVTSG